MSVLAETASPGRERSALIEESILPTSLAQRPINMLGYVWMLVSTQN